MKPEDTKEDDESTISSEKEGDFTDTSDEGDKYDSESWVEWIRRSTSIADGILKDIQIEDWIARHRRRKFRWVRRVARRSDERRTLIAQSIVLEACPWQAGVGHPKKCWTGSIDGYFAKECDVDEGTWMALAQCQETWKSLENEFINK